MISGISENAKKVSNQRNTLQRLFKHLTTPLGFGIFIGLILNIVGGREFFTFLVKRSFIDGLLIFGVFVLLLVGAWISWIESDTVRKQRSANLRMYLLGISLASLVMSTVNIALNVHAGNVGGGIIEVYWDFPFVTIMGIPFHSIVWSLFSAILFSTIERVLKVWEDSFSI